MDIKKNAPIEEQMTENKKDLAAENAALKAELEAMKASQQTAKIVNAKNIGPKMVKIKIPKSKEKKEDVFVSVNFRTYQIQRGVEVNVPDFVLEVLKHQEEMLEQIMLYEEKLQSKNK